MTNMMDEIPIAPVAVKPVEFVDIFIPLVRYRGGNNWSAGGCFNTIDAAIQSVKSYVGIEDAKILHHVERFVMVRE